MIRRSSCCLSSTKSSTIAGVETRHTAISVSRSSRNPSFHSYGVPTIRGEAQLRGADIYGLAEFGRGWEILPTVTNQIPLLGSTYVECWT